MTKFDKRFWDIKYKENKTGWDIGYPSAPIKTYIDQIKNKNLKILIPGAGNGYEVEYLHHNGFNNVYVIDIAEQPLKNIKQRLPDFPTDNLIHIDFFDHNKKYDLIIEQTFFCALDPGLRNAYSNKMNHLLNSNGKLIGLFFDFELSEKGPPFGGSLPEYVKTFKSNFNIKTLEKCYNSIKPRNDNELFFIFEKKK